MNVFIRLYFSLDFALLFHSISAFSLIFTWITWKKLALTPLPVIFLSVSELIFKVCYNLYINLHDLRCVKDKFF